MINFFVISSLDVKHKKMENIYIYIYEKHFMYQHIHAEGIINAKFLILALSMGIELDFSPIELLVHLTASIKDHPIKKSQKHFNLGGSLNCDILISHFKIL